MDNNKLGTNLAEVGTDAITKQQAIDALRTCYDTETISMDNGDEYINYGDAVGEIEQLPPIQPVNNSEVPNSSDCISRRAAIDYCEALMNAERVQQTDDWGYGRERYNQTECIMQYIENMPSAEPQIIRCKDCKNWDTTWTNDFSPNYHYCPMVDGVRKEDWFCADAERRTE